MTAARTENRAENLGRSALLFLPVVAGLAASSILAVDYLRPVAVFCDPAAGCGALKQTIFASVLGVPTPITGLLGFLLMGWFAIHRGAVARRMLLVFASLAALVAVGLILVQFVMHTWCPFCLVTDTSACLLFGLALWRWFAGWDPPEGRLPRAAVAFWMVPAVAVPILIGVFKKPIIPEAIAREIALTPKGEVTVVDFADFECPFCRMAHATLAPLLAAHHDRVRVVRKNVPLTRIHPHALDAARAACCGESMGKGEAMADALFSAPVDDLTPDGCAKLAASLGLDADAFRKCTSDPATDAHINDDLGTFKASQGRGLPMLFIDEQRIDGYRPDDTVEKALERAIGRREG